LLIYSLINALSFLGIFLLFKQEINSSKELRVKQTFAHSTSCN